jgi:RNA-directed DNA polymerase
MDEGPNLVLRKETFIVRTGYMTEGNAGCAGEEDCGRNPQEHSHGVVPRPWVKGTADPSAQQLLEQVVDSENMRLAWQQVKRNGGAAGVDGRSVEETAEFLRSNWLDLRQRLLDGTYQPRPVQRVEIPKPGGGVRKLGIPTVVDRLVQQAISQVLTPLFNPEFSESSYGFRPGRSAHDAVLKAREYQQAGKRWVVDMDLKQFFDEVNHDILMSRLGKKVKDKRLKWLLNAFLKAGVQCGNKLEPTDKGTPQGGPLSPLLSNILLDDLDKELERRGHSFCRYADDCNIYVRSRRAGERVLQSVTRFIERLKLKVNRSKSAVGRPWERIFLGFSFTHHRQSRIRIPQETLKQFRHKLKGLFRQGRGRNLNRFIREDLNPVLQGWLQYFSLAETRGYAEEMDGWIRRRLRCIIWRQWKRGRTRSRKLRGCGVEEGRARASAYNGRGPWWNSGAFHMNDAFRKRYFDKVGLYSLLDALLGRRIITT